MRLPDLAKKNPVFWIQSCDSKVHGIQSIHLLLQCAFVADSDITWQNYAHCDQELAKCGTVDENWEANLLSSLRIEECLPVSNEDDEPQTSQVIPVKSLRQLVCGRR